MKVARLEKLYIIVLMVVFGGIILHAPISVGLGVLVPAFDLVIKAWKEILMICMVPIVTAIITKRGMWKELLNDWLFRLISGYALLHIIITIFLYQGIVATVAGLAIDLRYILFFGLVYVAIKVLPQYRRRMLQIATVGAFIVVGFATLQLFLPPDLLAHIGYSKDTIAPYLTVDKNPDFIRVNSTLRGPNPLGAYAGMVLGLLTAAFLKKKIEIRERRVLVATVLLATFSVIALWISYSRSALVAGIVTVMLVICIATIRTMPRRVWIGCLVAVALVSTALIVGKGTTLVSNVLLHENLNGGSSISSNEGHVLSLRDGLVDLVQHPFGVGVGSTGSASLLGDKPAIVENQYLLIAHETGWLGLLIFMTIYIVILLRLWHRRADWLCLGMFASGIGLGLIGLLLPVWVDDTVSIVWWGLAGIALAGGSYDRKQTK